MDSAKDPLYFRHDKYSYVPDGLVAYIAPKPGPLCLRCSKLDIGSFFIPKPSAEPHRHDDLVVLGSVEDIRERSVICGFCQLVIEALMVRLPEGASLVSKNLSQSSREGSKAISIIISSALAGSYYLGSNDPESPSPCAKVKQDVYCISISTTTQLPHTAKIDEVQKDQGIIRLLANDAHCLQQKPMYHGRLIGNHLSPSLLWSWIKACRDHHTLCARIRFQWSLEELMGPRSLRYVDTVEMCLARYSVFDPSQHIALSYVWGSAQGLQLTKENEANLFVKGALAHAWDRIPKAIQDAIELIRDLNTTDQEMKLFLWVDQLCIIQDDPKDKAIQIQQMSQTYSSAVATLVIGEGSYSNTVVSRHHPENHPLGLQEESSTEIVRSSESIQMVRNVKGLRLVAALPSLMQTLKKSTWNTRAWTLQEAELSHSSVVTTKHQVYFRCAQEVLCEDFVGEVAEKGYKEMDRSDERWVNSLASERRLVPAEGYEWPLSFEMYARIVESYTARTMTYPTDILLAFQGISKVMHSISAWEMLNGLIEDVIDYALLWRPKGVIKRRFYRNGDPAQAQDKASSDLAIPTYAWSAWQGPVTYEPISFDIKSLVESFESVKAGNQKRRLVRFSQNNKAGKVGQSTLEPTHPFAPQDCSLLQDVKQGAHWAKPMARNLAYRMRLVNTIQGNTRDGPGILQFNARCARIYLATAAPTPSLPDRKVDDKRVGLLDANKARVGSVWYVPCLDELDGQEVRIIFLSKNKSSGVHIDSWQFDTHSYIWHEWCLCNVMLVKRFPKNGLYERMTIGKVHEKLLEDSWEETVRLV